jgi:hypothetical protein
VPVGVALRGVRVEAVRRGRCNYFPGCGKRTGLSAGGKVLCLDFDVADGSRGVLLVLRQELLQELRVRRGNERGGTEKGVECFRSGLSFRQMAGRLPPVE